MISAKPRRLRSEQFRKKGEDMIGSIGSNRAEAFDQAGLADRAELIKDNLSRLPLKTNGRGWDRDDLFGKECVLGHSGWAGERVCHGSHDDRVDMPIHFIGRDDQAGASLSDFTAFSGIEANEIDLEAADYQRHPSRSH